MKLDGMKAMPTNETIIAVPIVLNQPEQVRQFLVRLVEKLDIVLGYRGDDPYVTNSQLQSTSSTGLTKLEQTILNVVTDLLSSNNGVVTQLLNTVSEDTVAAIDALKSTDVITDADNSTQSISSPPTQAEVQALQDQVVANANYFNDLLIALRTTEIIAT